jgi:hypothetical protein
MQAPPGTHRVLNLRHAPLAAGFLRAALALLLALALPIGLHSQVTQYAFDSSGSLLTRAPENLARPQITRQPQLQILEPGELAAFSVVVADASGVTYQWQFNGTNIVGATGDTLLLLNPSVASRGQYSVVVSNSLGSVTSAVAWLVGERTWTGVADSDWFNPGNWTPAGVPLTNDIVNIANGTINLTAPVTIAGQLNWWAGTLSGSPLTIASNGVMHLNLGVKYLTCPLTNGGTVLWTGSDFIVRNASSYGYFGAVENLPGALWDIQCDARIIDDYNCCGTVNPYFHNAGLLRKSAATGTSTFSIPLINDGAVAVLQGTLNVGSGGTVEGSFSAAAGAAIIFSGGSFSSAVPAVITGPGASQFTGGTFTLLSDIVPNLPLVGGAVVLGTGFQAAGAITNLMLAGSTLFGTNTVTGVLNWSAGSIPGPLTVAASGLVMLSGGGDKFLFDVLTNAGTVLWGGGNLIVRNASTYGYFGTVENLAGALWDIQCDAQMFDDYNCCGTVNPHFHNVGLLRKSAATGTTRVLISLLNVGAVEVLQGTLNLGNGGTVEGSFSAAAGAAIVFSEGSFSSAMPAVITGPGASRFTGGALTLLSDIVPNLPLVGGTVVLGNSFQGAGAITNLTLAGSTLFGTNTVTGVLNWSAGIVPGPLTVASSGLVMLSGGGDKFLFDVLTNAGTVIWGGGNLIVRNTSSYGYFGTVENLAGALWDIQCDAQMFDDYNCCGTVNPHFNNAGLLRKSAATGTTTISIPLLNAGAVAVLQGTLNLGNGGTVEGSFSAAAGAAITFSGGSFSSTAPAVITGPGASRFTGGTLTLLSDIVPNLPLVGGTVVLGTGFQAEGAITNLTLAGSTLFGTNTVTGVLNWSAGIIPGPLTVASSGLVVLSGGGDKFLFDVLTNAGTVLWGGGNLIVRNTSSYGYFGAVENLAGAAWDIQSDAQMFDDYNCCGTVNPHFHNAGLLRKSAVTGTTTVLIPLINAGAVAVLQGTLNLANGGTVEGSFSAAAGAAVTLSGGSFSSAVPAVITGPGTSRFTGGTLTLLSDIVPNLPLVGGTVVLGTGFQAAGAITNLTLAGSTLFGTNTVTGVLNWSAGIIPGPLTVAPGGLVMLSGGGDKFLFDVLTNAGTVIWGGGNLIVRNTSSYGYFGTVENLAGAVWDIQSDAQMLDDYNCCGTVNPHFHNAGLLRKSAATGTTTVLIPLPNDGAVSVVQGRLSLGGDYAQGNNLFSVTLGGTTSGQFGQLSCANATLSGPLTVNLQAGFVPATGDRFQILSSSSLTGTFSSVNVPPGISVNYNNNTVFLTVTSPALRILSPQVSGSTFSFSIPTANAKSYTVQTNSDVASSGWGPYTNFIGDGTLRQCVFQLSGPRLFFRLVEP